MAGMLLGPLQMPEGPTPPLTLSDVGDAIDNTIGAWENNTRDTLNSVAAAPGEIATDVSNSVTGAVNNAVSGTVSATLPWLIAGGTLFGIVMLQRAKA